MGLALLELEMARDEFGGKFFIEPNSQLCTCMLIEHNKCCVRWVKKNIYIKMLNCCSIF